MTHTWKHPMKCFETRGLHLLVQEGSVNTVGGFAFRENEDFSSFDYDSPDDAALVRLYEFGRRTI